MYLACEVGHVYITMTSTVYATTAGSPYVYRNFTVCTRTIGDNDMRVLSAMWRRGLIGTLFASCVTSFSERATGLS